MTSSENSNAVAANVSVPYGYWTFAASGSYSENQQGLTSTTALFDQTASSTLKADYLFFRDATSKWRASGSLSQWWNNRVINASDLTPQRRGAGSLGVAGELHLPDALLSFDANIDAGLPFYFGEETPPGAAPTAPKARFVKLDASAFYLRPFKDVGRLSLAAQAQLSADILPSPDQISIGGWDTTRGIAGGSASGDSGAFVKSEFAFQLPGKFALPSFAGLQASFEPYAFADTGFVHSNASNAGVFLMSAGGGIRLGLGRVKADIAAGVPVIKPSDWTGASWQTFGTVSVDLY